MEDLSCTTGLVTLDQVLRKYKRYQNQSIVGSYQVRYSAGFGVMLRVINCVMPCYCVQVLQDQIAKNNSDILTFIDGEIWGRQQYFVLGLPPQQKARSAGTSSGIVGTPRVFIPIPVEEEVDMLQLTDIVRGVESSYSSCTLDEDLDGGGGEEAVGVENKAEASTNTAAVEVYAAVYEIGGSIM